MVVLSYLQASVSILVIVEMGLVVYQIVHSSFPYVLVSILVIVEMGLVG